MRSNVVRGLFALVVVVTVGLGAGRSWAGGQDEGREHYLKGKALFDAADFKGAIAEFAAADSLAPSPVLEFNIALCYDKLGDKAEAVRRYRLYLDKQPNAANRAGVEDKIKKIEDELAAEDAQRRADEAKRVGAGADRPIEPPVSGESPGTSGGAGAAAGTAPQPTGDPELDRVNAIDVRRIRDERSGTSAAGVGGPAPAGGAIGQAGPAPAGGPAYGQPGPTQGGPPPAAPPPADEPKTKPIYKQWWFWVVVGVSAVILIDIATSDSSSNNPPRANALVLDPMSQRDLGGGGGGATLFHF